MEVREVVATGAEGVDFMVASTSDCFFFFFLSFLSLDDEGSSAGASVEEGVASDEDSFFLFFLSFLDSDVVRIASSSRLRFFFFSALESFSSA